MKRFKFSFIYSLIMICTTPFHLSLENLFIKLGVLNLIRYVCLGAMLALFLIAFFKCIAGRRAQEMAALLLVALIVCFFLFQKRVFLLHMDFSLLMHVAGFFFLGFILFKENRRVFSFFPFLILAVMAIGFELIQLAFPNRVFNITDIWINGIAGFCGLLVGYY